MREQQSFSEADSLRVKSTMIEKAKPSPHDNGTASIVWGVIITVCSIGTWASMRFQFKLPFDIWLLALLGVFPTLWFSFRKERKQKVKSYDQTAMDYVWLCFGIAIFLIVYTNSNVFAQTQRVRDAIMDNNLPVTMFQFSEYSSAYLLTLYGIPTIVTAGIKNFKPMMIGGIICWVCALLVVHTSRQTDMLLMAFSATTAWLIPGLILRARHQRLTAHV